VGDETIVPDRNELTNERVRLDSTPPADDGFSLNLHEWTNKTIVANRTSVEVYWFYHRHSFSEYNVTDTDNSKVRLIHHIF
jgi:hypothetical protein